MTQVVRLEQHLPLGMSTLAEAAALEGVRNVGKLMAAWEAGEQRFGRDGAALFAAFVDKDLVGVGGVKREEDAGESAMRMHRFYVHPMYRRQGVGRVLADAAMAHGLASAALLTCNARASAAAADFWEASGFAKCDAAAYTHIFRAGTKWTA